MTDLPEVNIRYRIMWARLSLWRDNDYVFADKTIGGGASLRVFTLWPPWVIESFCRRIRMRGKQPPF